MDQQQQIPRVEHEAALASLAAWSGADAKKDWLTGATPGMSKQAADARDAMTDAHADPYASDADIETAEAAYHGACLAQAADLDRDRKAVLARIAQMMRVIRAVADAGEAETTYRVAAVVSAALAHAGVYHAAILSARTTSERAAAG